MTTYYLAGPMTGHPKHNYPAFEQAAHVLRLQGYEIKSPHELDFSETEENRGKTMPYNYYLRESIKLLLECDGIIMLPGWLGSGGAVIERKLADSLGMDIRIFYPEDSSVRRIAG